MKKSLTILCSMAFLAANVQANLIMQEGFNYTIGSNNPDPDGGLNGGNGLPATNVGGNPTGTSTGLRGNWGTSLDVVSGLTYSQGPNQLTTSGGAGQVNNATWGTGSIANYRFMTTDPFISFRDGASTSGAFGVDGTTLYASLLMKLNANFDSTTIARITLSSAPGGNVFIGANIGDNDATPNWGISTVNNVSIVNTTVPAAAGDTALLVLRYTFGAANADTLNMWVNPTLGGPLGASDAQITGNLTINGIFNNTRPDTANVMVIDEFRLGETLSDVTPYTVVPEPSALALAWAWRAC
ncbi:MAG: hypothetical protein MUE94_13485 [Verrucomicrobia bacterium]|nr:hypothetical protein [Verrucomicrobiota bacterium]